MDKKEKVLLQKYPAIIDLQEKAERRIPNVAWEYLQSGTGREIATQRNLEAFDKITLNPQFFKGELNPQVETKLFEKTYSAPFGIAPVGIQGLMWPGGEFCLASTAREKNIPYCLSTVASQDPESVGKKVGSQGWFQLYPPRSKQTRIDLLMRAARSGFHTLVVTADVPAPSMRERTKRAGLRTPPKITPRFIWDGITNPSWTMKFLKHGMPQLKTILPYADKSKQNVFEELRAGFGGTLSWSYLKELRDEWHGPLIVKGVTHPKDANHCVNIGVDGLIVSNHGGRQFDGVPAAIELLPGIVKEVGDQTKIMFDSGVRSGLDILKAIHLGADFVFLGRAFMYGLCALGDKGGNHVYNILKEDILMNMHQLGISNLGELRKIS